MRICTRKSDGKFIAMMTDAAPGTLIRNAVTDGYAENDLEEREITASEWAAIQEAQRPPRKIPLELLQTRIEAEGVWDTYVNYMFGAPARRNAFLRIMMIGQPIDVNGGPVRQSLTGAGLPADQVNRILAPPA